MARMYSEDELLKAIEYACGYQKASCYQEVGGIMIGAEKGLDEITEEVLNLLSDSDNNCHKEITIEDIEESLKTA